MLALLKADARRIPLADRSVQCVVTSPPYWGLRKYSGEQELVWGGREDCEHRWGGGIPGDPRGGSGPAAKECYGGQDGKSNYARQVGRGNECARCGAWRGAYGLEPSVDLYVQHTVEILREIRRVLRDDGVAFWNIGDSYAGSWGDSGHRPERSGVPGYQRPKNTEFFNRSRHPRDPSPVTVNPGAGLKPKDLCLIPFRVALAAQADGWWVRSDIIWAKPNPMPESVTDRPTRSHEYILMLTKCANYYWDAEAVKEKVCGNTHSRGTKLSHPSETTSEEHIQVDGRRAHKDWSRYTPEILSHRNLRSVWTFTTEPYPEAHFSTFPEELPKRCILAATSSKGACGKCGTAWERIVKASGGTIGRSWHDHKGDIERGQRAENDAKGGHGYKRETVGWQPGCSCGVEETVPCIVLDPFAGSGTVGKVAIELGRRAVLCDLAYQALASKRTAAIQRPLLEGRL